LIAHGSISWRLTIWFSSVLAAGLALFGAIMWLDLKETLTSGRSRTLERRADRLEELLRATRSETPEERARRFLGFANATGGGLIEVFQTNGAPAPIPYTGRAGLPLAPHRADRE